MLTLSDLSWTGTRWEIRTADGFVGLDTLLDEIDVNRVKGAMYHIQQAAEYALQEEIAELRKLIANKDEEIKRYQQWVNDLQSGMFVNCVYCGHRYGPDDQVPASMAETLQSHIEQCPKHPMSQLKSDLARVTAERDAAIERTKALCYLDYYGHCKTDDRSCDGCASEWRGPRKEDGWDDN